MSVNNDANQGVTSSSDTHLSELFKGNLMPFGTPCAYTNGSAAANDMAADISWILRNQMDLMQLPSTSAVSMAGMTSALNIFNGWAIWNRANKRLEKAVYIRDQQGIAEASSDAARGVIYLTGGSVMGVYRATSFWCSTHHVNQSLSSSSLIGRIGGGAGIVGSILYVFMFVVNGVLGGIPFWDTAKTAYNISGLDDDFVIQYFKKELRGLSKESLEKRLEEQVKPSVTESLKNAFMGVQPQVEDLKKAFLTKELHEGVCLFLERVSEFTGDQYNKEEIQEMAKQFSKELNTLKVVDDIITSMGFSTEVRGFINKANEPDLKLGRAIFALKEQMVLEDKLSRVIGQNGVNNLKKQPPGVEAKEIVKGIKSELYENLFISGGLVVLGGVGAVIMIGFALLSLPALGGVLLSETVLYLLSIPLAILSTAIDGIIWKNTWFTEGFVGKGDLVISYANIALAVTSLTLIVLGSVASFGTLPVGICLVIGVVWVASALINTCILHQKNARYEQNQLTIAERNRLMQKDSWTPQEIEELQEKVVKALEISSMSKERKPQLGKKFFLDHESLRNWFEEWSQSESNYRNDVKEELARIRNAVHIPEESSYTAYFRSCFQMAG